MAPKGHVQDSTFSTKIDENRRKPKKTEENRQKSTKTLIPVHGVQGPYTGFKVFDDPDPHPDPDPGPDPDPDPDAHPDPGPDPDPGPGLGPDHTLLLGFFCGVIHDSPNVLAQGVLT